MLEIIQKADYTGRQHGRQVEIGLRQCFSNLKHFRTPFEISAPSSYPSPGYIRINCLSSDRTTL